MAKRGTKRRRRRAKYGFAAWSAGKKVAAVFGGTFLAVMTLAVVLLASKISRINTTEKLAPEDVSIAEDLEMDEEGYLNVALFGVDSRRSELEAGTRSDTIIVASLNKKTKEVRLASVYRDTLLKQDDGTYNKANAAYSFGGPKEAIALLNRNLDLDITHYVTVNFDAMIDVIDALGGVEVDVQDYEVNLITGYATEILEVTGREADGMYGPGPQVLNGALATAYCRIRYGGGDDYRRTERQRAVLAQIVQRAQGASLSQLNKIIDKVFPEINTNFTLQEILQYAKYATKYRLGETVGFPYEKTTARLSGVGDSVIATNLENDVLQLHKFFFGEDGYMPTETVKEITRGILVKAGDVAPASEDFSKNDEYTGNSSYNNNDDDYDDNYDSNYDDNDYDDNDYDDSDYNDSDDNGGYDDTGGGNDSDGTEDY